MLKDLIKRILGLGILFTLFIFTQCGKSYIMEDNDELKENEGILFFDFEFNQGAIVFSNLSFTLENIDKTVVVRFSIDSNTKQKMIYHLKAGKYTFTDVKGRVDEDHYQKTKNEKANYMSGLAMENVFTVEANKINCVGKIQIYVKSKPIGNTFKLEWVAKSGFETIYFLPSYPPSLVQYLNSNYPKLSKLYPVKRQTILFSTDSLNVKGLEAIKRGMYVDSATYDDEGGWGNYKWGMNMEEVKLLLIGDKKKFNEKTPNLLVQKGKSPVEFYFSELAIALWKNRLYKVNIYLPSDPQKIIEKMSNRYGQPQINEKTWLWETGSTFYIVKDMGENNTLLSYVSKEHDRFYKQFQKK